MHLTPLDWTIMAAAFAVYLGIGLLVGRKAGRDYDSFFLSGRTMPWWLLGISMVATTFATDTPNLVAGIVRRDGVFGNWVWWAFLLTGTTTVFLYAKLWRRSRVLTDIEFYELRYSGRPAAFLRGFRAVYLGVFFNVVIMANVTLAAIKIGGVLLGLTPMQTITIAAVVTLAYSMAGGLTGVLLTDLVQFGVAMVGSVGAAIYISRMPEIGGLAQALARPEIAARLDLLPDFHTVKPEVLLSVFFVPLLVQWWSAYYPGAEPGGGGYVVQRVLAARNEKHAAGAALLFNVAHYALRPWPWIIVALCSLVVFPDVASLQARFPDMDPQFVKDDLAYPAMLTYLPAGLLGLVVTSLIAAFMSTMSTQVNWGSSVLVNDLYRRFLRPAAGDHELVWAGRFATLGLMVLACAVALIMQDAVSNFELMLQIGAGTGLLLLLRWFWWRINAAAEIAAVVVSASVAVSFFIWGEAAPEAVPAAWVQLLVGVGVTTLAWLLTTLVTPPTDGIVLARFYARVRPSGPGWRPVAAAVEAAEAVRGGRASWPGFAPLVATIASTLAIWAALFAVGNLLYGRPAAAAMLAAVAAIGAIVVGACWPRLEFR